MEDGKGWKLEEKGGGGKRRRQKRKEREKKKGVEREGEARG